MIAKKHTSLLNIKYISRHCLIVPAFICLLLPPLQGQYNYSVRLHPWEDNGGDSTLLILTSRYNGCAVLEAPSINKTITIPVTANTLNRVWVDTAFTINIVGNSNQDDYIGPDGIIIRSTVPIELYHSASFGLSSRGVHGTTTGIRPIKNFKDTLQYFVNNLDRLSHTTDPQWHAIPLYDSTHFSLFQTINFNNLFAINQWDDTLLYEGEVLHNGISFLTAPVAVKADKPLSVYHILVSFVGVPPIKFWPSDPKALGQVSDLVQQMPEDYYSNHYLLAPFFETEGELYNIMSLSNQNQLLLDGQPLKLLQRGDRIDTILTGAHVLSGSGRFNLASSPLNIFTTQADGSFTPRTVGFMVMPEDTGHLIYESVFPTEFFGFADEFFVQVIMRTSDTTTLHLDDNPVANAGFTPFPADSNWAFANFSVPPGLRKLSSPKGFLGVCYGRPVPTKITSQTPNSRPDSSEYYGFTLIGQAQNISPRFEEFSLLSDSGLIPIPNRLSGCDSASFSFVPPGYRHTTWQWDFGDSNTFIQKIEGEAPDTVAHFFGQPGSYTVNVSDINGCAPGTSFTVEITATPTPSFKHELITSCSGTSVLLTNTTQTFDVLKWEVNGKSFGQQKAWLYENTEKADTISISLEAGIGGCFGTYTEQILLKEPTTELSIPNVFTPNGDGVNDCYGISGASAFEGCFSLEVFNRFGKSLFKTDNPNDCWDGKVKGKLIANGVYFYLITLGEEEFRGHITVL